MLQNYPEDKYETEIKNYRASKKFKFFVGGVPQILNHIELQRIFQESIQNDKQPTCRIVKTSCFDGYAFIIVENINDADVFILEKNLTLKYNGRILDIRIAKSRKMAKIINQNTKNNKILVKDLSREVDNHQLTAYFSKFGQIESCYIAYDSITQKSKGFGFLTYKSNHDFIKVLKQKHHNINGKLAIACKSLSKHEIYQFKKKNDFELSINLANDNIKFLNDIDQNIINIQNYQNLKEMKNYKESDQLQEIICNGSYVNPDNMSNNIDQNEPNQLKDLYCFKQFIHCSIYDQIRLREQFQVQKEKDIQLKEFQIKRLKEQQQQMIIQQENIKNNK